MTTKQQQQSRSLRSTYRITSKRQRLNARRGLIEYMLIEMHSGSSISGLYCSLLIRTLLAEEPVLTREYPDLASEPPQRSEPSIPRVRSRRASST